MLDLWKLTKPNMTVKKQEQIQEVELLANLLWAVDSYSSKFIDARAELATKKTEMDTIDPLLLELIFADANNDKAMILEDAKSLSREEYEKLILHTIERAKPPVTWAEKMSFLEIRAWLLNNILEIKS